MLKSPLVRRDPEAEALRTLARRDIPIHTKRPLDSLQELVELARELTSARYGALVVIDDVDNVEGFVASGLTRNEEQRLKSAPLGHGPLGSMRKDGLAVRIDDLSEHAAAVGFPPKHPAMRTLMGLPLDVEGRLRGALYVTDRDGGKPFRDRDEAALAVLARHAGRVIATSWF
jgi:two-component system sensor histidine kinase DevS